MGTLRNASAGFTASLLLAFILAMNYSSYSLDFASMYGGVLVRSPLRGCCCLACLSQLLLNLTFAFNIFNFVYTLHTDFLCASFWMFMLRTSLFHLIQVQKQMLRNGIQCGIALRMFPSDLERKKKKKKRKKSARAVEKRAKTLYAKQISWKCESFFFGVHVDFYSI